MDVLFLEQVRLECTWLTRFSFWIPVWKPDWDTSRKQVSVESFEKSAYLQLGAGQT